MIDMQWWAQSLTEDDRRGIAEGHVGIPEQPTSEQRNAVQTAGLWLGENPKTKMDMIMAAPGGVWGYDLEREFVLWVSEQPEGYWRP
jgi:hypothetical protein